MHPPLFLHCNPLVSMAFNYYLSFGVLENHRDELAAVINQFGDHYTCCEWSPYLIGPSEITYDKAIYINIGCRIISDLSWLELKLNLKAFEHHNLYSPHIDIDILIQTMNHATTIISPKTVHYTHSIMLLNQLNQDLIINQRPIHGWLAGKENVHDFRFITASSELPSVQASIS